MCFLAPSTLRSHPQDSTKGTGLTRRAKTIPNVVSTELLLRLAQLPDDRHGLRQPSGLSVLFNDLQSVFERLRLADEGGVCRKIEDRGLDHAMGRRFCSFK